MRKDENLQSVSFVWFEHELAESEGLFSGHLFGMVLCLCKGESPKQFSFCRFFKVGRCLTKNVRKRIFCRERRTFVKRTLFLRAKSVVSFNAKNPRQSGFGNKNVRFIALFVQKIALKSRVDFSQPKCVGRLKSTLPAAAFSKQG